MNMNLRVKFFFSKYIIMSVPGMNPNVLSRDPVTIERFVISNPIYSNFTTRDYK
jgi:hypothetical protein